MRAKIFLPKSLPELQALRNDKLKELWLRYFKELPMLTDQKMVRILLYKIQCENHNLYIEQKNITKLNRYSSDPEGCVEKSYKTRYHIRSGTEIVKTFKGKQFKVLVQSPGEFIYDGKSFKTLSAVAKVICGKKVSGYDFFGINNKHYKKSIAEDERPEIVSNGDVNFIDSEDENIMEDEICNG